MRKISGKQILDTQTDAILKKTTVGSYGDPTGYEETLFLSDGGVYYIYTSGGEESPYPAASLKKISKKKAEEIMSSFMAG